MTIVLNADIDRRPHTQHMEPAKELEQLIMFAGSWTVEGENLAGAPIGADTRLIGNVTYEWLPGNYFMVCRWNRHFGDATHIGIGVIGYKPDTNEFSTDNYDNLGDARTYTITAEQRTWKFTGDNERATMKFSEDGKTFSEYWEISKDGIIWHPLCDMKGTRVE